MISSITKINRFFIGSLIGFFIDAFPYPVQLNSLKGIAEGVGEVAVQMDR